jgi:rhamnosyltransferase
MANNGVCAVVITFHPTAEVLQNIAKVRPQTQGLLVVDNGSSAVELGPFHAASTEMDFMVIENGENLGVAAALNQGIRWAQSQGYECVILLDQDSTASEDLIETMLAEYASYSDREQIAVVVPRYVDRKSGHEIPVSRSRQGEILVARTSGGLTRLSLIPRIGLFLEDFVIDQVDYEYCLRLGALGYKIVQCNQAVLTHSLGDMEWHDLGVGGFVSTHHNAKRRYYMTRNRIRIVRLYWRRYPAYCFDLLFSTLKDTIKIVLVEKSKYLKLKNTAIGVRDALINRMGKTVEL